jgi:CRP-like cAMP-binding protein
MGPLRGRREAPWIEQMRSIWLFCDCTSDELGLVDSLCTGADVAEGRPLLRQGDLTTEFLVIASGTAVAAVDQRPIAMIEAGSFVGDMALFGRGVQRASVTSATAMSVLAFSVREAAALIDASIPSVEEKLVEVLAERRHALAEHWLETQVAWSREELDDRPALTPLAI